MINDACAHEMPMPNACLTPRVLQISSSFYTFRSPLAMRHRCVEDDDGSVDEDSEEPTTRAATFSFSFSLSSSNKQLDDSMSVS